MMTTFLYAAFCVLTVAIALGLVRLARGPTVIDRILAFDLITTSAVGMIVLLSIQWKTAMYLELILVFSLLGFFGTVAFVYYLSRTQDLEQPSQAEPAGEPCPQPAPDHD
ncbi:MAG TPA: monovalent cation/H+ antiporter complex subunit F [Verrucomicrobiae bacterium]